MSETAARWSWYSRYGYWMAGFTTGAALGIGASFLLGVVH